MDSFSIGLSGLEAALKGLETIGNNMANAATEGFHRQRVEFVPAYSVQIRDIILGGGVDIAEIRRVIDNLLEQQIIQQRFLSGQISQELATLRTVESAFGELASEGTLGTAIDAFFNALHDLSAHPDNEIYQAQVVSAAEALANQFQMISNFLAKLENQIVLEVQSSVDEVNTLINQIAELNGKIESFEITGGQANNLRDQRDQCIAELAELIGIETLDREYGVVDVSIGGIPVVTGCSVLELEAALQAGGLIGISAAGAENYKTEVQGGKLGGLFALKNELILDVHNNLDSLAAAIIQQVNQYHVQGVGSEGSFTALSGWRMASANLADYGSAITDGEKIYFRLTNESTEVVSRESITVNTSDTLSDIATKIDGVTGLTATVDSANKLSITASGYKFDFLPAVLPSPTGLTGTSSPTMSGIYTGTDNDTFRFTVIGNGSVGNGTLQLQVKDNVGAGDLIATLDVGSGYAAGDRLHVADDIYISLSAGTLKDTETFDVEVFADTDESGLLAAVGLNTFFSGSSASDIAVRSEISAEPGLVATCLGGDMTDNTNAVRMAGLRDESVSSLNNLTFGEFYRDLVTQLGQDITIKDMQQSNIETVMQSLVNQRDEVSGIDMNEQAAQMLVFERMFQAMAKYMSTAQLYYETLFGLL